MPSKEISRLKIEGHPGGLSINSSDELIVQIVCDKRSYINIYRSSDGMKIRCVPLLCTTDDMLLPVVQSSNGNLFIVHRSGKDRPLHMISEVTINGTKIIRSIDHTSIGSNESKDWWPSHLSIDEDDNIFVADFNNDRIVLWNPRSDEHRILVKRDQHQIVGPWRLCYVREKQMLIVGHGRPSSSVSLFSLSKHRP